MDGLVKQLFRYDDWANREVLNALRSTSATPRSLALFAHIVGAEWLWMSRLRREPPTVPVWPRWDLNACAEGLEPLRETWHAFLDAQPDLDSTITYENSKGEVWRSTVREIASHVVLHSTYHRGQIAQDAAAAGQAPAYTDYIHCTRQGMLD